MSLSSWSKTLTAIFDSLYSERRQRQLDRLVVNVSVAGLIAHLMLVFGLYRQLQRMVPVATQPLRSLMPIIR